MQSKYIIQVQIRCAQKAQENAKTRDVTQDCVPG